MFGKKKGKDIPRELAEACVPPVLFAKSAASSFVKFAARSNVQHKSAPP